MNPANQDNTALHTVVRRGQVRKLKRILERGAFGNTKYALLIACATGQPEIISVLLEYGGCPEDLVPAMLEHAYRSDRPEAIKTVLKHTAPSTDPDDQLLEYLNAKQSGDRSLLFSACSDGKYEMVKFLLEHGDDKRTLDTESYVHGLTALHVACLQNRADIAELLVRHGASRSVRNDSGCTPADLCRDPELRAKMEPAPKGAQSS